MRTYTGTAATAARGFDSVASSLVASVGLSMAYAGWRLAQQESRSVVGGWRKPLPQQPSGCGGQRQAAER